MDIFAHGISTAAAVVARRRTTNVPIRLGWALFFGVFPDLVTFTIPACLRIWWRLTGASPSLLPTANGPHFEWAWSVYNGAHSLLVFAVVFAGLWLVMGRPILEALGWLLHILLDIFSHRGLFAIQFLWPASSVHLDGIPWETPWFLAATYGILMAVGLLLLRRRRRAPFLLLLIVVLSGNPGPAAAPQTTSRPPAGAPARGASIELDSTLTLLQLPETPEPVQRAVSDLASDFAKVFGTRPRVVTREQDAGPVTIVVGEQAKLPESLRGASAGATESFSIAAVPLKPERPGHAIVLSGADVRGTIYAVYQFSQEFLGVDPLYYWTDHEPVKRASIQVPATLNETFPPPVFTYRGFFINDEDLLTGWAPGEKKDGTGIALEVWDKIFETTLRLKGNMVCPGTWIFPDEPQVALAGRRGLILTQHHAIPLGLNVARWPKDVPYNYTSNPDILERAWTNAVGQYPAGLEVLWTVGLRGLSDVSYAAMDPAVSNDNKALGALIGKAISQQMQIVRAVHPDAKFITSLWQEGARLVQSGELHVPAEVSTVWADDGYGYIQDQGQVVAGQGIYDHIAMMNGRANQLTEMVPVERTLSEMGRYIKARATHYFLVNTSDLRPVTMSTRLVMDVAWKGLPEGGADGFLRRWSAEEFGKGAADSIAALYRDYFKAPAHLGDPLHEYGDQLYHTEARRMLLTQMLDVPLVSIAGQTPKWQPPRVLGQSATGPNRPVGKEWLEDILPREIKQCGEAQPRWDAAWKKAVAIEPHVAIARRPFYRSSVLTMIAINRESNRALYLISKAIQDARAGQVAGARAGTRQAVAALEAVRRAQASAEYGKWKNWYRGDWLAGVYRTRELTENFARFLDDPETHLPLPVIWDEAYYHIMHYEGDRSADVK